MFEATTRIANALYEALRAERMRTPPGMTFDGAFHSEEPPGWFAVVDFLADVLRPDADAFAASTDLIAMIQVALRDCDRAISKEREKGPHRKADWIELLNQQRAIIHSWLNNRDLLPKEGT